MVILDFEGHTPSIDPSAYVADGAAIIGRVDIAAEASVWFNAVLRGDEEPISIGRGTNIQDGCVLHTDPGYPCIVGDEVTVGHGAVVHGCTIGDGATIGMGATVLSGACIGKHALVAAGALVLERTVVPSRTLVAGVPAKPRRELDDKQIAGLLEGAASYNQRRELYLRLRQSITTTERRR